MNNFKKNKILIFLSCVFSFSFFANSVSAVCPVCVVAVSTCVGLSRYLGVDDTISGVWIGGLIFSMVTWTVSWLNAKNIRFIGRKALIFFSFYGLSIGPLYYTKFIGQATNKLWGMDKLMLGIFFGTVVFVSSFFVNAKLKEKNDGKVFFPFQKVVVPVVMLGILSGIFYFLTC